MINFCQESFLSDIEEVPLIAWETHDSIAKLKNFLL